MHPGNYCFVLTVELPTVDGTFVRATNIGTYEAERYVGRSDVIVELLHLAEELIRDERGDDIAPDARANILCLSLEPE